MSFFDGSRGGTSPAWLNDLFDDTARLKSGGHGEPEGSPCIRQRIMTPVLRECRNSRATESITQIAAVLLSALSRLLTRD